MPLVVGMRARTTHSTQGRFCASRGCECVGVSKEVSTGIDLGSECRCREGVLVPGVEGGVKAGEMRFAGTLLLGEGG